MTGASLSLALLKRQAERGSADAQFERYCLFRGGTAASLSLTEAREHLVAAARHRHRRAMRALGSAYQLGRLGFPVDEIEALRWYRRLVARVHEDAGKGDVDARGFFAVLDEYERWKRTEGDARKPAPLPGERK